MAQKSWSKFGSPLNQCQFKVPHENKQAAKRALERMMKNRGREGGRLRPYKCDFCGKWHLGTVHD